VILGLQGLVLRRSRLGVRWWWGRRGGMETAKWSSMGGLMKCLQRYDRLGMGRTRVLFITSFNPIYICSTMSSFRQRGIQNTNIKLDPNPNSNPNTPQACQHIKQLV
jgi:hypothetical protein